MWISSLNNYIWVAIGGALGSLGRFLLSDYVAKIFGVHFPWGTLAVNGIGSFVIGYFSFAFAISRQLPIPEELRVFVLVGFCGGFTTFSSFSLQTFDLLKGTEVGYAIVNIAASVVVCLSAVWLGIAAARAWG